MVGFYNSCNIRDEIYRGWVGGRGMGLALGAGEKPKSEHNIHKETNYNVVSSVGHRDSCS